MPRRPLLDISEWKEKPLARIVSRIVVGAVVVLGLLTLALDLA